MRSGQPGIARPTHGCRDIAVPPQWIRDVETDGGSQRLIPVPHQAELVLKATEIRRSLPQAPRLSADALLTVDLDQSASVRGGNDVIGLRHELLLIALTHLGARRSPGHWYVRISTFDGASPIALPCTRLDKKGLEAARRALPSASAGGSSILGPSLRNAQSNLDEFPGPQLLVVLSDFELLRSGPISCVGRANRQLS